MKLSKLIYRIKKWTRNFSHKKEKSLCDDSEHKFFIRAKRNKNHLPDSWTHTRWIPRFKSWKNRSKVKHQYEKHKLSDYELDTFYENLKIKQNLIYKLITLYKKDGIGWLEFSELESNRYIMSDINVNYYLVAFNLCEEGILIGEYIIHTWTFFDFGKEQTYTKKFLKRCRINPEIL